MLWTSKSTTLEMRNGARSTMSGVIRRLSYCRRVDRALHPALNVLPLERRHDLRCIRGFNLHSKRMKDAALFRLPVFRVDRRDDVEGFPIFLVRTRKSNNAANATAKKAK